jgi:hypothetical protein
MVGSPAEVQEARSREQNAAAKTRRSPFARLQPAEFKFKFPLGAPPAQPWPALDVRLSKAVCLQPGNGTCVNSASLKVF